MTQRKHTHNSDSHADLDEDTDAIEPEALEPTDEEVTEEHDAAGHQPSKEPQEAPLSTSLVPVTTLQQYLTEIRRYPYLSKEEELRLFEEYQLRGSRDAASQPDGVAAAKSEFHNQRLRRHDGGQTQTQKAKQPKDRF